MVTVDETRWEFVEYGNSQLTLSNAGKDKEHMEDSYA